MTSKDLVTSYLDSLVDYINDLSDHLNQIAGDPEALAYLESQISPAILNDWATRSQESLALLLSLQITIRHLILDTVPPGFPPKAFRELQSGSRSDARDFQKQKRSRMN